MEKDKKQAYLQAIIRRYRKANRAGKSKILDEFCAVCGYHRKYALTRLNRGLQRPTKRQNKPGKRSVYAVPEVLTPLKKLWLATDQLASKRLKVAIPLWLPYFEQRFGALSDEVRRKLTTMSAATLDRLLAPIRAQVGRHGMSGTKPGSLLKNQIPIAGCIWDESQPGFMEADTVAHCGDSLAGGFIWSLTLTDLYSGWTECRAIWGKSSPQVIGQIEAIRARLPFALRGFDCDNGSEFLNWHLMRYLQKREIRFTRSRPYHKNDNAHVEQKNWSCVRQLFGYERFDRTELVGLMNNVYANEWSLLTNFFLPTMKLREKMRVGSKIVKKHGVAQTPAQRLLDCPHLNAEQKAVLKARMAGLDPFVLRELVEQKLKRVFEALHAT